MSLVEFYSGGQRMFGNLHIPYARAPCIICLHGLESSKDGGKWLAFSSRMYDEGYACFRFSFRGCGEKSEKSGGKFEDASLTARIQDYRSALEFLQNFGEVDMARLGVVGSSFGGMTALAAQDIRVKAIVVLASPYKVPRCDKLSISREEGSYYVLPSGRRLKKSFYEDVERYDLLEAVREAPALLIIHGDSDETVPLEHSYELYEAASEPKRLQIIEGADHAFTKPEHLNLAIDLSLTWFKTHL